MKNLRNRIHIYDISLTNGEQLQDVRIKGSLELRYSGVGSDFVPAENNECNTVVFSKYQIVKAELKEIGE